MTSIPVGLVSLTTSGYTRENNIVYYTSNMRPDRRINIFINRQDVSQYSRNASKIVITDNDAGKYRTTYTNYSSMPNVLINGTYNLLISESTNTCVKILKGISPNTIYVDEALLHLKLDPYGGGSFTSSSFIPGETVFQTPNNYIINRGPTQFILERGGVYSSARKNSFYNSIIHNKTALYSSNNKYKNTSGVTTPLIQYAGRVLHWFTSNSTLVLESLYGTANTSGSRILNKLTSTTLSQNVANVSVVRTTSFPVSSQFKLIDADAVVATKTVSAHEHKTGIILAFNPSSVPPTVNLSSSYTLTGDPVPIKIVAGKGVGQSAEIVSMASPTVANLSLALVGLDHTSIYGLENHIIDESGNIVGVCHTRADNLSNIRSGPADIKFTDSNTATGNSTTQGGSTFIGGGTANEVKDKLSTGGGETTTSSGGSGTTVTINDTKTTTTTTTTTTQPGAKINANAVITVTGTGIPTTTVGNRFSVMTLPETYKAGDPVAQTFFTPKTNYGMYITSVDLFFKSKPSADEAKLPVKLRIVSTLNGYPSDKVLGTAIADHYDVVTTDGANTFPRTSNTATQTKFTFPDPIFLNPSSEYAIMIQSDSPSYELWTAEIGENVVGDPNNRRVSEQPYVGSFFRSQNASTWTPYQNEDLMFRINRASFETSPVTVQFSNEFSTEEVAYDEIFLNALELEYPKANINHKIKTSLYSTSALEDNFTKIEENKPIWFATSINSISATGRRRVIPSSNTGALQTQVILDSDDDFISPFLNAEAYSALVSKNLINNGELYESNITITNPGIHNNVSNITVTISGSNLYPDRANSTANGIAICTGNSVTYIELDNPGLGYIESPTITISEPGALVNATAVITSEDSKYGGNALCRYITKKVNLADGFDSGDLRVTLRAIRPQGTNIVVYYKVQSESDSRLFSDIRWRRMYLENDIISPDLNTAIDFKYNPSNDPRINKISYLENGVTYPLGGTFKYFAIKIVLLAECGCVAPTVRNLRAIALPEG